MPPDWTWLAAIAGAVGVFWNQAKALFSSIKSLFIVTSEVPHESQIFLFYCWDHFRVSKLGIRRFGFEHFYLRPHRRTGLVAMEFQGKTLTFWHGWWPLMLNLEEDKSVYNKTETLTMTYFRGTFNGADLIHQAAKYHNRRSWGDLSKTTHRYRIIRKFGFVLMEKGDRPMPDAADSGEKNSMGSAGRPIGMSRNDLGVPIEKEPFKSLFYGSEVHDFFTKIQRWKTSRDWYHSHTISWRLGGLLKGIPGTGKTSFVRAMAQDLDFPIMIIDLPSMSNRDLTEAWREALSLAPIIVLFEDIDRLFNSEKQFQIHDQAFSMRDPVSLDCLLNCISGVEPSEGIVTIATANTPQNLDPALLRAGRLDFKINFSCPSAEDRYKIATRILDNDAGLVEQIVTKTDGATGATVVQMATELAVAKYWGNGKGHITSLDTLSATDHETVHTK